MPPIQRVLSHVLPEFSGGPDNADFEPVLAHTGRLAPPFRCPWTRDLARGTGGGSRNDARRDHRARTLARRRLTAFEGHSRTLAHLIASTPDRPDNQSLFRLWGSCTNTPATGLEPTTREM
jgi:hypothetical protein